MGNNTSRSTQWSEEPAKPSYPMCSSKTKTWPFKSCTLQRGHGGNHCEKKQAGTKMVEFWWAESREAECSDLV